MTITVGQKLPEATFLKMGDKGPETVELSGKLAGRKVAIFAMPGAFSATCSGSHIPNILMHKEALEAKGVEEILIVCVNDPY
ncbi:MAG: redoxin family protein, partial [Paracoccaceae bacterium]|nr:redoxin family protein [Paracoccaceae bacterium]